MTDLLEELYMPIIEKETTLRVRTTEHHLSKISLINADDCLRILMITVITTMIYR